MKLAPNWTELNGVNTLVYKMKKGDTAVPFALSGLANKTVAITGIKGGATVEIVGGEKLDQYTKINLVNNKLQANPSLVTVSLTGGDSTTNVTITFKVSA